MTDRRARAVTESAMVSIKSALDAAETPDGFLRQVDEILGDPANLLALPTDHGQAEDLRPGDLRRARDIESGPVVYEFLGALDPSNASDPRLWTYLAFSTFRNYMELRWPLSSETGWKNRVLNRWLLQNASRAGLIRHGIARLWWVSSLTYDGQRKYPLSAKADDPFAYTRAAFRNEDRLGGLFERESGSVGAFVRAALEYIAASDTQVTEDQFRALMKDVTLVYGFRDIEVLDDQQMRDLVGGLAAAT